MRVLLWMVNGDRIPGGHRVQVDQTARALREIGVDAQVSFAAQVNPTGYAVIHGFGLPPDRIRACRLAGVPVVLSTIYCGYRFISGAHIDSASCLRTWAARARTAAVLARSALAGAHFAKCEAYVEVPARFRTTYEMADLLLPNSDAEAAAIVSDLGVTTPMHVVPNAVDHHVFTNATPAAERTGVLYVGRFEPHKNQLGLVEAMRGSSIPVTIAGPQHPDHAAYYQKCIQRAAGTNIRIVPGVPHDELPALYRTARVHVLPSWFETTGLVSLEAALCGCNVVTTGRGYAKDYFGDLAWYCDPADRRSIREAVEAAYAAPLREGLRDRILQNYTWEHTARATLAAYEKMLVGGVRTVAEKAGAPEGTAMGTFR